MVDLLMERIGLDAGLTCRELREFAALAISMGLPEWGTRMLDLADRWQPIAIETIEEAADENTCPYGLPLPPE